MDEIYTLKDSVNILQELQPSILPVIQSLVERGESPERIRQFLEFPKCGDELVYGLIEDAARYYERRK